MRRVVGPRAIPSGRQKARRGEFEQALDALNRRKLITPAVFGRARLLLVGRRPAMRPAGDVRCGEGGILDALGCSRDTWYETKRALENLGLLHVELPGCRGQGARYQATMPLPVESAIGSPPPDTMHPVDVSDALGRNAQGTVSELVRRPETYSASDSEHVAVSAPVAPCTPQPKPASRASRTDPHETSPAQAGRALGFSAAVVEVEGTTVSHPGVGDGDFASSEAPGSSHDKLEMSEVVEEGGDLNEVAAARGGDLSGDPEVDDSQVGHPLWGLHNDVWGKQAPLALPTAARRLPSSGSRAAWGSSEAELVEFERTPASRNGHESNLPADTHRDAAASSATDRNDSPSESRDAYGMTEAEVTEFERRYPSASANTK